ncbi:MAG: hypothetical protein R3Y63_06800 [Eubacteriales bacterium]
MVRYCITILFLALSLSSCAENTIKEQESSEVPLLTPAPSLEAESPTLPLISPQEPEKSYLSYTIAHAQALALENDHTLIIYELYHPYEVQKNIIENLTDLSTTNPTVKNGITLEPWSLGWFIATAISNHQRGYAMDVSLGKVTEYRTDTSGDYQFLTVISAEEYEMQTPIHELSYHSASLAYPVNSGNDEDWRNTPTAEGLTEGSVLLRNYCTNAGLTPLASEWWHFNDLDSAINGQSLGNFQIESTKSQIPF